MKLFQLILFAGISFVISYPVAAQQNTAALGQISGNVVQDETGEPVVSATIGVWNQSDSVLVTGTITGAEGEFAIAGVRPGTYYVSVSFVGSATKNISNVVIGRDNLRVDLGTIRLSADLHELGEVEVAAERSTVQFQIDRTVYSTADTPIAIGGTATNVLETIPSLDVDVDGNISLRGSGNVAVLINGRPAPVSSEYIATYLRQLPAGAIDRVEVIPNPSSRYEPDGMGGIINIVLKEDVEMGFGGTILAGGDSQGGYNTTGTFTFGRGPLNLTGTYGFRQEEGFGGGTSFRVNRYSVPLTYFDQFEDEDESETSHLFNLAADYRLSSRTLLNASAQVGYQDERGQEITDFFELDATRDPIISYERLMEEGRTGLNTDFRAGLEHNFSGSPAAQRPGPNRRRGPGGGGGAAHSLTAEFRMSFSDNDGDEFFTEHLAESGDLRERQNAFTENNRQRGSLQLDYVLPISDFRFEAGYKGDVEKLYSDLYSESASGDDPLSPDVGLINTFDYDQTVHALYSQLARQWDFIGVQLGLRAEQANTTFFLQNTNESYDNGYFSLFPSAFLTVNLNQSNILRASYSRRIHRPRTWWLNPFPSYDDPLNIRIGNPYLKPEYIDAFEFGYVRHTGWGSVTLTPYYRRTTDVIRRYQELRDNGVTVWTTGNFDTSTSSGLELITSLDARSLLEGLSGYVSIEGFRMVTDGSNVNTDFQNNAFGWGGRLNASYAAGNIFGLGDLSLQGTFRYRAPMKSEQGRSGAFSWTDIALRQALLNERASLTLRVRDVFGTAGFRNVIDQPNIYNEFEREFGAQAISLTFSYSFGKMNERDRRDRNRPDDRGEGGEEFEMGMEN